MAEYTSFTLPSGAVVQVQSSADAPAVAPAQRGPMEAATPGERAWKDGAALVAELGAEAVEAMRRAFAGVDEVTVEFGANISGKSGVILVEGSVAANLKVTVKWKASKPDQKGEKTG
jgi:hypothetical protein